MPCQLLRTDGSQQALVLEQAHRLWPRLKGLLGRQALAPAQGLWLSPCNSVHCLFMRFSIDVLYLDRAQRIIAIRSHLKPWQLSLHWPEGFQDPLPTRKPNNCLICRHVHRYY